MNRIDLVMAGVRSCTGSCVYCSNISIGNVNLKTKLDNVSNKTYDEVLFDFDKLENRIVSHPTFRNSRFDVSIWGADPLSSFYALQDTVDFINYIAYKYKKTIKISTSTNGVPICDDGIVKYLIDNNIGIQLSHDGVAEELRLPIDPLKEYNDAFKEIAEKSWMFINCVAHAYNTDFKANMEYFKKWAPFCKNIRFSKVMPGVNYSNAINKTGFKNGKYYEELKGKPFGDFSIPEEEIDEYLNNILNLPSPFYTNLTRINPDNKKSHSCQKFIKGEIKEIFHIDTLGNYTTCNLLDSQHQPGNPTGEYQFPDECKTCKWKESPICTECIISEPEYKIHDHCVFLKKLNEALSNRNK